MKTLLKGVYAFFMAALVLAGCQKPVEEEPVTIRLNKTLISSLPVGSTQTLTATIAPEGAKVTVVWSSEDDAVAVVNENGEVTGKYCDTHVNKKDDNGNIIDFDGSGEVEDCGYMQGDSD